MLACTVLSFYLSACGKGQERVGGPHEIDSVLVGPVDTPYGKAFPIDAQKIHIDFTLDASQSVVQAVATLDVKIVSDEYKPLLAFPSDAVSVTVEVDGRSLSINDFLAINLPETATSRYHVINASLESGQHEIVVRYSLTGKTSILSSYSDLSGRGLQAYVPCNPMLYDRFDFSGTARVSGTSDVYRIYSNSDVTNVGPNEWTFAHPVRANALAPYFHVLKESSIAGTATRTANGINGPIAVQAYRTDPSAPSPADAAEIAVTEIERLEPLLGTYAHGNKFVIFLTAGRGGMEYAGATITSLSALKHEVFHSWFATGVFPRYYSDAWLDEALARWFDNSNPATPLPQLTPIRLAGYSPYDLQFPADAYGYGSKLMAHLAYLSGGTNQFMQILGAFFEANKLKTVTTEEFRDFVENWLAQDLDAFFLTYVYKDRARLPDEPTDSTADAI